MMSIHAVKGVGIGEGFGAAKVPGSQLHDEILGAVDRRRSAHVRRDTNRAGGLEGGITNGEPIIVRVAMKPISTLMRPLATIDMKTGEAASASVERSDVTAVPAMGVIAEAMLAFVVAQAVLEKFGGDSMIEVKRNLEGYLDQISQRRQ
jgi:chorismate synthase